ncbi:predicted protein, partial [Nematostella vectensis]
FDGNYDRNTVVSHHLLPSIQTRYIRIYPVKAKLYYHGDLRIDFFGCQIGKTHLTTECGMPLGIQNGRITDAAITASSFQDTAHRARLHTVGEHEKPGAWVAGVADLSQWLQIDFGSVAMVTHIATQGRFEAEYGLRLQTQHWVTSFKVSFSQLGRAYQWLKNTIPPYIAKEFPGNSDCYRVVQNDVNPPIIGWYVRLHPVKWHIHPAMRVEMYG